MYPVKLIHCYFYVYIVYSWKEICQFVIKKSLVHYEQSVDANFSTLSSWMSLCPGSWSDTIKPLSRTQRNSLECFPTRLFTHVVLSKRVLQQSCSDSAGLSWRWDILFSSSLKSLKIFPLFIPWFGNLNSGISPKTFSLRGDSANHCSIVQSKHFISNKPSFKI